MGEKLPTKQEALIQLGEYSAQSSRIAKSLINALDEVERLTAILERRDAILQLAKDMSILMATTFEDAVRAIARAGVYADPSKSPFEAEIKIREALGEEE